MIHKEIDLSFTIVPVSIVFGHKSGTPPGEDPESPEGLVLQEEELEEILLLHFRRKDDRQASLDKLPSPYSSEPLAQGEQRARASLMSAVGGGSGHLGDLSTLCREAVRLSALSHGHDEWVSGHRVT